MRGIEICESYYKTYGEPMLESEFKDLLPRIAVGIAGEGSECFGYDDDISRDHDFEPCFCMWLTEEDERKYGFALSRAYAKLPKEFMGLKRQIMSPVGGDRHGVMTINAFYEKFLGGADAPDTLIKWLYLPEYALAAASNGKVFRDDAGIFSEVRGKLLAGWPEDVRLKKLAARAAMMAQAGQYNFVRCVERGETGAAQLAVFEFVKNAISAVYLLNNAYEPYYKWSYRGMRDLKVLGELEAPLTFLTETGNSEKEARGKAELIEDVAAALIKEFKAQNLTKATCNDLEKHAYSITDKIKDANLRAMHIMEGAN